MVSNIKQNFYDTLGFSLARRIIRAFVLKTFKKIIFIYLFTENGLNFLTIKEMFTNLWQAINLFNLPENTILAVTYVV